MERILLEVMLKYMEDRGVIRESQHGLTKGKLCLTSLPAFYNQGTASLQKGRATDVIYVDFCKALMPFPTTFLPLNLRDMGFDGWTVG